MAQKQFIIDGGFTTDADSFIDGNLDLSGHNIANVGLPTADNHASNKIYTDVEILAAKTAAELDATTKSDTAQTTAISTASADATTKANAAQIAAEADATNKVASEASLRISADNALTLAVNTEKSRIDSIMSASTADADTFAEVVSLINSVDATNDSVLAGEIANRTAADAAIIASIPTNTVQLSNGWAITENGSQIEMSFNGSKKFKLDASGNLTVTGNITGYGSI